MIQLPSPRFARNEKSCVWRVGRNLGRQFGRLPRFARNEKSCVRRRAEVFFAPGFARLGRCIIIQLPSPRFARNEKYCVRRSAETLGGGFGCLPRFGGRWISGEFK